MTSKWLKFGVLTLCGAALVHWAAIAYAPELIMDRMLAARAEQGAHTIAHAERSTASSRRIVRPSLDLLYSTCLFDVSKLPLKVMTAAPADTYWSVAFYAANTDNFFVLNDTQTKGNPATIVIAGRGQTVAPQGPGIIVVSAPSDKGLVLFRTLINNDARLPELDQQRRAAKCEAMR
jgi:uncharacterized membrane protein